MTVCAHFGICGGCSLQNLSLDAYRARKRDAVVGLQPNMTEAKEDSADYSSSPCLKRQLQLSTCDTKESRNSLLVWPLKSTRQINGSFSPFWHKHTPLRRHMNIPGYTNGLA